MEFLHKVCAIFVLLLIACISAAVSQNNEASLTDRPIDEEEERNDFCGTAESCIRFCCSNKTDCSAINLFDLPSWPKAENLSQPYKILKRSPKCEGEMMSEDLPWWFLKVRRHFKKESN